MKVVAITAANSNQPDTRRREHDDRQEPSRALVAIAPMPAAAPATSGHRDALFVAQLIATKGQHPQTRERRRADPEEAIALYRAAGSPAPAPHHISRQS